MLNRLTVNIVNIHDKHENKVDIKSEMESADYFDDEIWDFKILALISGKILFTQP